MTDGCAAAVPGPNVQFLTPTPAAEARARPAGGGRAIVVGDNA